MVPAVSESLAAVVATGEIFSDLTVQDTADFRASYASGEREKDVDAEIVRVVQRAADLTERYLEERTHPRTGVNASDLFPIRDMKLIVGGGKPTVDFASVVLRFHREGVERPSVVVSVERNDGPWEIRGIITDENIATDIFLKIPV